MTRPTLLALSLMSTVVAAQAPQLLGYQGRLLQSSGAPVTGPRDVRFTLFSAETAGTQLWTETQQLGLSDGYYSTSLGATGVTAGAALEAALVSGTAWLELAGKEPAQTAFDVLTPRQRVGSVAYALNAKNVSGGTVNGTTVSIAGSTVIDATGRYVGPAIVTATAPLTATANAVGLTGCPDAGQVLSWSGTAWGCQTIAGPGAASGDLFGTYPGPTVARIRGVNVAATAPTTGQVLRYSGTDWQPEDLPIASTSAAGLMRVGVGLATDGGSVGLQACATGQALVATSTGWACAKVPSGANTLAQFQTYGVQAIANPAPSVSCNAGDVMTGCYAVTPGGSSVCGTVVTDGTCITSGCALVFVTIGTCLRVR